MTIENETPTDRRGYVIRTIRVGETCEVSGYGVEILGGDGQNEAGRMGRLYPGLRQDNIDPARPAEPFIPCVPGVRRLVVFDKLLYVHDTSGIDGSTPVRVRIMTLPRSAFVDADPIGAPRVRYLARSAAGGVSLAAKGTAGDAATIYRNDGQIEDRFWEEERFDARQYWCGIVIGTKNFELYAETKPNAFDATRAWCQRMVARDYATAGNVDARMVAFQGGPQTGYVVDFNVSTSHLTLGGTNIRVPFPHGIVALHILNLEVLASTVHYLVGTVGHQ